MQQKFSYFVQFLVFIWQICFKCYQVVNFYFVQSELVPGIQEPGSSRNWYLENRSHDPIGTGTWRTGTRIQSELVPGQQEPGSSRNWYLESMSHDPVGTRSWITEARIQSELVTGKMENRNQDPVGAGTLRTGT